MTGIATGTGRDTNRTGLIGVHYDGIVLTLAAHCAECKQENNAWIKECVIEALVYNFSTLAANC